MTRPPMLCPTRDNDSTGTGQASHRSSQQACQLLAIGATAAPSCHAGRPASIPGPGSGRSPRCGWSHRPRLCSDRPRPWTMITMFGPASGLRRRDPRIRSVQGAGRRRPADGKLPVHFPVASRSSPQTPFEARAQRLSSGARPARSGDPQKSGRNRNPRHQSVADGPDHRVRPGIPDLPSGPEPEIPSSQAAEVRAMVRYMFSAVLVTPEAQSSASCVGPRINADESAIRHPLFCGYHGFDADSCEAFKIPRNILISL